MACKTENIYYLVLHKKVSLGARGEWETEWIRLMGMRVPGGLVNVRIDLAELGSAFLTSSQVGLMRRGPHLENPLD